MFEALCVLMMPNKKEPINIYDRLGIGLLAAISFLLFHCFVYGIALLSMRSSPIENVEGILVFLLSVFIWGPIISFFMGFILLINPIEIILKLFK